jgi:hypothetical protein
LSKSIFCKEILGRDEKPACAVEDGPFVGRRCCLGNCENFSKVEMSLSISVEGLWMSLLRRERIYAIPFTSTTWISRDIVSVLQLMPSNIIKPACNSIATMILASKGTVLLI